MQKRSSDKSADAALSDRSISQLLVFSVGLNRGVGDLQLLNDSQVSGPPAEHIYGLLWVGHNSDITDFPEPTFVPWLHQRRNSISRGKVELSVGGVCYFVYYWPFEPCQLSGFQMKLFNCW